MMSEVDWDSRYRDGETPWEKGMAHPALPSFLESHSHLFHPQPRVFHPGCGFGHDAALLAPLCREITAIDIAEEPIATAQKLHLAHHNIHWQLGDLFTWPERDTEHYDLVWEHTCFCAIPLDRRPDYAKTVHTLLKPRGYLAGVFFLEPDHAPADGPPFGVTREELDEFFGWGFQLIEDLPNPPTYPGRENRETIMIWQRL